MKKMPALIFKIILAVTVSGCHSCSTEDDVSFHGTGQFFAGDGSAGDYFGKQAAVSSDGTTMVVAAPNGNIGSNTGQGSVYVYRWSGTAWVEKKITASDGAASDNFGTCVAVSANGNVIVSGAVKGDGQATDSGAAYLYRWDGTTWGEYKLIANDGAANDQFARIVAVSSDGGIVAVGSPYDDDNGTDSGSAYVYKWNGASYSQFQKLTASDGATTDYFGASIAVSADGSTVVVGADYGDNGVSNQGTAYAYRWNGSWYIQTQKLTASDAAASDFFGISVSVSNDGSTIAVGAWYADAMGTDSGAAYIFKWDGSSTYNQTQKLTASDGAAGDYFGNSVTVSGDGSVITAGAPDYNSNQGTAWIFAE